MRVSHAVQELYGRHRFVEAHWLREASWKPTTGLDRIIRRLISNHERIAIHKLASSAESCLAISSRASEDFNEREAAGKPTLGG